MIKNLLESRLEEKNSVYQHISEEPAVADGWPPIFWRSKAFTSASWNWCHAPSPETCSHCRRRYTTVVGVLQGVSPITQVLHTWDHKIQSENNTKKHMGENIQPSVATLLAVLPTVQDSKSVIWRKDGFWQDMFICSIHPNWATEWMKLSASAMNL